MEKKERKKKVEKEREREKGKKRSLRTDILWMLPSKPEQAFINKIQKVNNIVFWVMSNDVRIFSFGLLRMSAHMSSIVCEVYTSDIAIAL